MVTPTREEIIAALQRAGWQIDADEPQAIEASDGKRYGVGIFFERSVPVEVCYGDSEEDLRHSEEWHEAPGILSPKETRRLFRDEPPQWPRIGPAGERDG